MTQVSNEEWEVLFVQAAKLDGLGTACPMCGGTGGWRGPSEWVPCRPCAGTGSNVPTSATVN